MVGIKIQDKRKKQIIDALFCVVVFIVIVTLSIGFVIEFKNARELNHSIQQIQTELNISKQKNIVHEKIDIDTSPIEGFYSDAYGQVRIERVYTVSASGGEAVLVDKLGKTWTLNSAGIGTGDVLMLMIADNGTKKDTTDDVIIDAYINKTSW